MEIIQRIDHWLATGGNYDAGVTLYVNHGPSTFLKEYFAGTRSKFAADKLKAELKQLRETLGAVTPPPSRALPGIVINNDQGKTDPPAVAACKQRIKDLLPIISTLHGDLYHAKDDATRFALATQLVQKSQQRAELWRMIDRYNESGVLPTTIMADRNTAKLEQIIEAASPQEIARRIQNIPPQITKARQAMEKATDDDKRLKYQHKMETLIKELELLKKQRDELPIS